MLRFALIAFLPLVGTPAAAQAILRAEADSRVQIVGSSNAAGFICKADSVSGQGMPSHATGALEVPVDTIDCGNRRMTRDLRELLRAADHPAIRFELSAAHAGAADSVAASGSLTIAGATRSVTVSGRAEPTSDGRWRLHGSKRLLLTDFGIHPPRKFFGLIRVHNEIHVRFELLAAAEQPLDRPDNQ